VRVDDGRWHHVVVTFDRDTEIAIYVDGTSVRRSTGAVTGSVSNAVPLLFGGEAAWYPAFAGDLDEVAVYAKTLGATAVKAHYDEAYVYDTTEPSVTLTTPSPFASTTDTTPTFGGTAGTATGDLSRVVVNVYSGSLATGTPVQTASTVSDRSGRWAAEPSPPLAPGTYTARAEQADGAGNVGRSAPVTFTIAAPPPSPPSDPVLLAAGDIAACDSTGDEATANLLDGLSGTVAAVGDTVYPSGTDQQFADCYDPSWGRHKSRTLPAVGDHEYETPGAAGYFRYFGASAGDPAKGWYSYDLGAWHVVVINSTCVEIGGCDTGSAQEQWLRADLAAHPASCTLAYWGEARFSSGSVHGNHPEMEPFWQALADYGAEVVLSGDDHVYERFAPQTPAGYLDLSAGITQFVIGTGGSWHYGFDAPEANSQVRNGDTFGILKLSLHSTSYDWQFVPVAGKSFTDFGSRPCH
jgi:hypothetical protein